MECWHCPRAGRQEVTRTGINSVANGVSQATPAGISAAKDAFENTTSLGTLSGNTIQGGIAAAAQQLSPAAYLLGIENTQEPPESLKLLSSVPAGVTDQKMFEGISKKLTRERLDSLSNHSEPLNFGEQNMKAVDWGKLLDASKTIRNMLDAFKQVQQQGIVNMR